MCKNCKTSDLGIARQAELDTATAQCRELNVNPATIGFLVRHRYRGQAPRGEQINMPAQDRAAVERYNAATDAMKKLHEDYVWSLARKDAEARTPYITHGDKPWLPLRDGE